jgi:hypothetical protein
MTFLFLFFPYFTTKPLFKTGENKKERDFSALFIIPLIRRQIRKVRPSGKKQCRGITQLAPHYPYLGKRVSKIEDKR